MKTNEQMYMLPSIEVLTIQVNSANPDCKKYWNLNNLNYTRCL